MGCIYNDFNGHCQMWDEESKDDMQGCDEEGDCICEEDPDPSYLCEMYESNDPEEDEEDE